VNATMKLAFNAFSDKPNSDPNEIHLEAVDYDIVAQLQGLKQENVYGGYHAKAIDGTLKANNQGLDFSGSVTVGDASAQHVTIAQPSGKALNVTVRGETANGKTAVTGNDFSVSYLSGPIPVITLSGKRLDASVAYGGKGGSLLADFPAMKLDIALDELLLVADAPLRDVRATMECSAVRCDSAEFSAKNGAEPISGSIRKAGASRQFLLTSNDAGSMLKALDITDRMTKGTFELRGEYDDKLVPPQLNARLLINNFTLKNSQILGRILSIGSLTGLTNALTGSGIAFDKLSANIASRSGVITIDKGMAQGTALGITVAGTVNTAASVFGLKGVVAPAYALNSMLGKIPVIGFIAGGEGEGLIAFNYWVKGPFEDPDVGVNPLSGLTPGFLRGIFGIFEEGDKKQGDAKSKGAKSRSPAVENPTSNVEQH